MATTQIIAEPGVPQVVVSREFDAYRDLLFRAHTDPDLLVQWLGPRELTMTIDRFDLRDGGTWRFVRWDVDGNDYGFHGVFHGEPSASGMVWTYEAEGTPGHVVLETATFAELGGKTLLTQNSVFQSARDRDRALQSGVADAAIDSMDRLDELLTRLAPVG